MLKINHLSFTYPDGFKSNASKNRAHKALTMCFDLQVKRGEILSIIGASGSGKTTLLNLIAGFNQAQSGEILINDQDIAALAIAERPVTTVFQAHNLFPHLDVYTNVAIGVDPSLKLSRKQVERVENALASMGLGDYAKRRPSQLSGGQRQRVALARALVREQPILLLDEPLAALGPAMRDEIIGLIRQLVADNNQVALFVSHQPEDALLASQRCAFIHQGRVLEVGDCLSLLKNPQQPEIKGYLGV